MSGKPSDDHEQKIDRLISRIPHLTNGQLYWLDRVVEVFENPHEFDILDLGLLDEETLHNFGDALRIHHTFSVEPFSKDKFEYVLERVLLQSGHDARLAPKGNRGHDITIDGKTVSLKTQADRNIRDDKIWISKFMELGQGEWGEHPDDLIRLREAFLRHLASYEKIFTLRALRRAPNWHYELVEIPKSLMLAAKGGELEMKFNSRQYPKPGYCHVRSPDGEHIYQLYFDGGTERKLQVKNLSKSHCIVHAAWRFTVRPV